MVIYTWVVPPWDWEDCTRNKDQAKSEFLFMQRNIQNWEDNINGTTDWLHNDFRSGLSTISDSIRWRTTRILELWSGNWEYLDVLFREWFKNLVWIDIRPRHKDYSSQGAPQIIQQDFSNVDNLEELFWKFDLVYSKLIFDSYRYSEKKRKWVLESAHKLLRSWGLYYCLWPHDLPQISKTLRAIKPRQHTLLQGCSNYIPASP